MPYCRCSRPPTLLHVVVGAVPPLHNFVSREKPVRVSGVGAVGHALGVAVYLQVKLELKRALNNQKPPPRPEQNFFEYACVGREEARPSAPLFQFEQSTHERGADSDYRKGDQASDDV